MPRPAAPTSLAPLTHHEMLALVEPFVRAGIAPDLAASDRAACVVAFHAREVPPPSWPTGPHLGAGLPWQETWRLDASQPGELAVWREVGGEAGSRAGNQAGSQGGGGVGFEAPHASSESPLPSPARARLEGRCAKGSPQALASLLGAMQGVASERLFVCAAPGDANPVVGVLTQRLLPNARAPGEEPALVLKVAQARVGGLMLRMSLSGVGGYPAELELLRPAGPAGGPGPAAAPTCLPHDLLAVLGRAWEPLTELGRGWVARVSVRGEEPRRSREARELFGRTLAHLAQTLQRPPADFHPRHRRARWAVVLRGLTPWLVGAGVVAVALWARQRGGSSVLALLANVAPPLLMGLFFVRREMPRLGLPRWPAPLSDDAWPTMRDCSRPAHPCPTEERS